MGASDESLLHINGVVMLSSLPHLTSSSLFLMDAQLDPTIFHYGLSIDQSFPVDPKSILSIMAVHSSTS